MEVELRLSSSEAENQHVPKSLYGSAPLRICTDPGQFLSYYNFLVLLLCLGSCLLESLDVQHLAILIS